MMPRPGGYACLSDPEAGVKEWDTITCAHCNSIVHVKPRTDPADIGGLCKQCMGLICRRCVRGACAPFLKRLDDMEARERFRRAFTARVRA
jgi:hypothetical protein